MHSLGWGEQATTTVILSNLKNCGLKEQSLPVRFHGSWGPIFFLLWLLQLSTTSGRHRRLEAEEGKYWLAAPIIPLYSSFLKQVIRQQMKPTLLSNQTLARYSRKTFQKSSVLNKIWAHVWARSGGLAREQLGGGDFQRGLFEHEWLFLLWRLIVISQTSKSGSDERSSCSRLTQRLSSSITFLTCCGGKGKKKNHCGALSGSKQQRAQTRLET